MCCLSQQKNTRITIDSDSLRSEIRDKSVRVIDVRREEDYKQNHIPSSVNLPLANLLSDDSPERVLKLFQNMGMYLYHWRFQHFQMPLLRLILYLFL